MTGPLRFLVLCLAFLRLDAQAPAPPQEPAQTAPAKPDERCEVSGQVLDVLTGTPLAKAEIVLHGVWQTSGGEPKEETSMARSDAGGRFIFRAASPGKYDMEVERRGYVSQSYGARGPNRQGTTLSLNPGQRLTGLVVRLTPQGVITGKVVDEDGEPLAHVQVSPMRFRPFEGSRRLMPGGHARTDDLGEFRLHSLPPGRYYVQAVYQPMGGMGDPSVRPASDSEPVEGYVPTFYPGTQDVATAAQVDVAAGAEVRGLQIKLLQARTYRIRGRVINTVAGRVERRVQVFIMPRERDPSGMMWLRSGSMLDRKGNFVLRGVLPGAYYVTARWFDQGGWYLGREKVDVTSSDVEDVVVTIAKGPTITGRVRTEDDASADLSKVRVFLRPTEPRPMGRPTPELKEDGSFSIENVAPGEYRVRVSGVPAGYYLKSATLGDNEVLEAGLTIEQAGAPGPLEIVLGRCAGQVDGVVLDEQQQPAAGASVVLLPEPEKRKLEHLVKSVSTDQNGHFSMDGIPPGEYKLFAWGEMEWGQWQDQDFMKPFESRGEEITVRENSRESVRLKLLAE